MPSLLWPSFIRINGRSCSEVSGDPGAIDCIAIIKTIIFSRFSIHFDKSSPVKSSQLFNAKGISKLKFALNARYIKSYHFISKVFSPFGISRPPDKEERRIMVRSLFSSSEPSSFNKMNGMMKSISTTKITLYIKAIRIF